MDCTFTADGGRFNYRVGIIIRKENKILMARNPHEKRRCYYSVGGRVHYGESMQDAALREVREETGVECELDRLVCIHENFFYSDEGIPYHEISCYFTVRLNEALAQLPDGHRTDQGPEGEYLTWVDPKECEWAIHPDFFRTEDFDADSGVRHCITREWRDEEQAAEI